MMGNAKEGTTLGEHPPNMYDSSMVEKGEWCKAVNTTYRSIESLCVQSEQWSIFRFPCTHIATLLPGYSHIRNVQK